jgi:4-amino-4-deoxy-L-arabinose transferase-like glycosyltransferase
MWERRLLTLILLAFLGLGSVYALTTPVFEASDELWHYPMVKHLADGNPLPVQVFDPELAGPWKQEASQPPLYYYLGAALTFWIDTSDLDQARRLNPHVDTGVLTEDGNINLVVHDPALNQGQGTILAVRIIRLFSVLLGAWTVYLTHRIASESLPGRPEIALGAAAVNAFTPMFLFISGAVNNDNLVVPLASLSLLLAIRLVTREYPTAAEERRQLLLLGTVIGLGALTKITAVGLLPVALGALWLRCWRRAGQQLAWVAVARVTRAAAIRFLLILAPALLVAGWWYVRNVQLYGDWSGWNAFIAVLGQRAHAAGLAQLWGERWGFLISYWGLFGGLNVAMPRWVYWLLNGVLVAGVLGFVVYAGRTAFEQRKGVVSGAPLLQRVMDRIVEHAGLVICLVWSAAVVLGLIRWATVTWSSQGRLLFSAISALSTLLVLGLAGWLRGSPSRLVVAGLAVSMFLLSAAAPWLWIRPAYAVRDARVDPDHLRPVDVSYGGRLMLTGYWVDPGQAEPGDRVDVWLRWRALAPMEQDWSVFVHLVDPALEAPVAQRDMYPGRGLLATRFMQPGQTIVDRYQVLLPPTLYAPANLELLVGLYDFHSGERLTIDGSREAESLGMVRLLAKPGELPNPLQVNYENRLMLLGYAVEPRRLEPGETVTLTMYWSAQRSLAVDYTLFAQIVDRDTTRWASRDQQLPTSAWPPGELQRVELTMQLAEDTPPGVYPLIVGAYTRPADGSFDRLQTVTPEGRLSDDFLVLTLIRVD